MRGVLCDHNRHLVPGLVHECVEFHSNFNFNGFLLNNANLAGCIEVDESYFGCQPVRGKRRPAAGSKTIVFGVFKRNGRSDTKLCRRHESPRSKRLSAARLIWIARFMPMAGAVILAWLMSAMRSVFGLNMGAMNLSMSRLIVTASRPFGLTPNGDYASQKGFTNLCFIALSKKLDFVLITAVIVSIMSYSNRS